MKHVTQRMSLSLCALLLMMLFAACGGPASTGTTPGNTPAPTPTPQAPTATPTPAVVLKTYTGTNFTISYPPDWTTTDQAGLGVAINDPLKVSAITVLAFPLPVAGETATQVAAGETTTLIPLVLKGSQPITTVAPTTTLAGDTWVQKAFTGMASANGQDVKTRVYMLVDVHNGKAYVILYGAPDVAFDAVNTQYFQAMLQTFKFVG